MQRRIERTTSRTAEMTCLCRAASNLESNPLLRSGDWVARKLLPRTIQLAFRFQAARRFLVKAFAPEGTYEWVIARTRYIDALFAGLPKQRFSQVLLFGAGFDTRGIRFRSELQEATMFELDAPTTQSAKIAQYRQRGVALPSNLVFVPINFETDSVAERLGQAGFRRGMKTLVLAEGVTQYLKPEAVFSTLETVSREVGKGSWFVFDYAHASVLRGAGDTYGEERMMKGVTRFGESWQFGLDEGDVGPLLARYGFKLLDRKGPAELEEAYFRDESGNLIGRVNGTQSIVTAERL
jgi:methyltransferase (TIGR00027 family)